MSSSEDSVPKSIYRKHVLRARSIRNHFTFCRDWVQVMGSRDCTLFVQDLINRASHPKVRKMVRHEDGEDREYFLCTFKFLRERSSLRWDDGAQKKYLNFLRKRGCVRTINKGQPQKRWLWIDVLEIEMAVDRALAGMAPWPQTETQLGEPLSIENQSGAFTPDWTGVKAPDYIKKEHMEEGSTLVDPSSKQRTHTRRRADEGVSGSSGGVDPSNNHTTNPFLGLPPATLDSKAARWTKLLWDRLAEKRLLNPRRSHFRDWVRYFEKLRTKGPREGGPPPPDDEIETYLLALLPHIQVDMDADYWPVVHSAKAFCDKFYQVKRRVDRKVEGRHTRKEIEDEIAW